MKILFVVYYPKMIEVLSNLRWNGTLITELTQEHVENIIMFCTRKANECKTCGFSEERHKFNGHTYTEWITIMRKQLDMLEKAQEIQKKKHELVEKHNAEFRAKKAELNQRLKDLEDSMWPFKENQNH